MRNSRLKHGLFLIGAIVLLASGLQAQAPKLTAQPNTLYVSADGRYESAPDTAWLQFNIAAQDDTAKGAYDRASRGAQQVRDILRSNGIDPHSAEIGFFSVAPVYDYRQPKRKLLGYRVSSSVSLKLKDFSKVAGIVEQLANIDITENNSLTYTLENLDAAKARAVEDAYKRARGEASALATAGGRTVGELLYGSVDTAEQVRYLAPRAMASMNADKLAAAPPPTAEFSPQSIIVTSRINALFALK